MAKWWHWLLKPPVFEDKGQMQNGRILHTMLLLCIIFIPFLGLLAPLAYKPASYVLWIVAVAFLLVIGNLILLRKKYLYQVSLLFCSSIWFLTAVLTIYSGGVEADAYNSQFIVILMAGLLLGWRAGFFVVILNMLWGLLLMIAAQQQLLPASHLALPANISAWVAATITFVITAVWLYIAAKNNQRALSQLRDSNQQLQARTRELEAVRQIGVELAANLDLESLLTFTVKTAAELLDSIRGGLFLYRPDENILELMAHYDFEATPVGTKLKIGQGLAGMVWQLGHPLIVDNYREWSHHLPNLTAVIDNRAVIGVILQLGDEKLGVLTLTAKDGRTYTQHDIELLNLFTVGATVAIQNARLHQQQQQTEAALRASENAARVLLNAPPDDFFLLDKSGLILDLNEMAAYNFGLPPTALIKQAIIYSLFSDEVAASRSYAVEQVLKTGVAVHFEDQRNGKWFDNRIYPVFNDEGKATRVAVYARDISAQKAAQAERELLIADLEAKNTELERFTYTVSHDLKSPIVTITGFLGFIEKDVATGNLDRVATDIARIRDAAEKMKRLLNDLLELSRIGRLINPPVQMPFADIVQEALALLKGHIATRNAQITIDNNLPLITADRLRLIQVMQNLIDNGLRFMGEQPTPHIHIGVRYNPSSSQPIFFVKDNGIGIDPTYHDIIFGLFNRLNPTVEGTGIGLALVKRIVEVHGGKIWVESAVGHGATFCFTLG